MSVATEKAYQLIRRKLLDGQFEPGARLNELELADLCNVSRTPVREAIRRLAGEFFVTIVPNRGAFVVDWTREDIGDFFEMRAMLEGFAARKAAIRATDAQINEMKQICEEIDVMLRQKKEKALDDFLTLNRRFHDLICEASGNFRLLEINSRFVEQAVVARTAVQYSLQDLRRSNQFHVEITDAIRAKNPELAETLMRSHILNASALYREVYLSDTAGRP